MLGLATNLAKGGASLLTYVKDNLKLYLDFTSNKSDTLKFPCEGSTDFDGNDYIAIQDNDSLDLDGTGYYTIAVWLRADIDIASDTFNIANKYSSNTGWMLSVTTTNNLRWETGDGSGVDTTKSANDAFSTTVGKWQHCAITGGGGGKTKMYIDGVELGSLVTDDDHNTIATNTTDMLIGVTPGAGSGFWNGAMANLGMWDRALSLEEINSVMRKNYSQLKSVEKTSLVSWWALDDVYLGSTTNASDDNQSVYDTAKIMEDKNGSVGSNLVPDGEFESGVDNWTVVNGTISLNSDGNMLITGVGGTASARLNALTLEVNTFYLLEVGIAGGSDTSINIRYDDEAYGDTKYGGVYSNASQGTNASPKNVSSNFTSDSSNTGFYLNIGQVGDGETAIISHVKLYKVTSGNYGSIFGATTTTSVYGGNAPVLPRAVDVAREGQADAIGNGSALLDGTDDYIQVDNITLPNLEPYTITAWIKTTDVDQTQAIALWGDQASYERRALIIYNGGGGSDWTLVASTNGDNPQGATNVTEGEWTHASITVTPATKAYKIYMNGILDGSGTFSNSLVAFSNSTLLIGKSYYGEFFEGNISGVGIWYGELTQAKIQSVMESTSYAKIPADVKNEYGDELIVNGTMEADSNWSNYNTPDVNERSSEQAHSDTYSRKVDTNANYEGISSDGYTTVTGDLYTVSFWVYPTNVDSIRVRIQEGDGSGDVATSSGTNPTFSSLNLNAWNEVTFTYVESSGGSSGKLIIESGGNTGANNSVYYIDDASVKEVKNEIAGYWALDADSSRGANGTDDSTTGEVLGDELVDNLNGTTSGWDAMTGIDLGTSGDYVTATYESGDNVTGIRFFLGSSGTGSALSENVEVGALYKISMTGYITGTTTAYILSSDTGTRAEGSSWGQNAENVSTKTFYYKPTNASGNIIYPFYEIGSYTSAGVGYVKDVSVKKVLSNTGVLR